MLFVVVASSLLTSRECALHSFTFPGTSVFQNSAKYALLFAVLKAEVRVLSGRASNFWLAPKLTAGGAVWKRAFPHSIDAWRLVERQQVLSTNPSCLSSRGPPSPFDVCFFFPIPLATNHPCVVGKRTCFERTQPKTVANEYRQQYFVCVFRMPTYENCQFFVYPC